MSVIDEIAAERRRQIEVEGWDAVHDDEHTENELARAAYCYVGHYFGRSWVVEDDENGEGLERYQEEGRPDDWPDTWADFWWKPKNPRRDLVRAAALIIAEIERLDRLPRESSNGK